MENVGTRLKQARQEMKLSARKFAELVTINMQSLYRYERGERTPSVDFINRVAEVTGKSPDWLIRGQKQESTSTHEGEPHNALLETLVQNIQQHSFVLEKHSQAVEQQNNEFKTQFLEVIQQTQQNCDLTAKLLVMFQQHLEHHQK